MTADSETVLDEFEERDVYVIGGVVDRNRYKGLTKRIAEEKNIRTARFPLDDYQFNKVRRGGE